MYHPIRRGGPKTDAGKAASSQNATRHGFTSTSPLTLRNENPETWKRVVTEHEKVYAPANPVEQALVEEIAFASWKLRRMATVESGLFDNAMDRRADQLATEFGDVDEQTRLADAFEFMANNSKALALFARYHTQIERSRERAINALRDLQAKRQQAEQAEKNKILQNEPSKVEQNQQQPEITERTAPIPATTTVTMCPDANRRQSTVPEHPDPGSTSVHWPQKAA